MSENGKKFVSSLRAKKGTKPNSGRAAKTVPSQKKALKELTNELESTQLVSFDRKEGEMDEEENGTFVTEVANSQDEDEELIEARRQLIVRLDAELEEEIAAAKERAANAVSAAKAQSESSISAMDKQMEADLNKPRPLSLQTIRQRCLKPEVLESKNTEQVATETFAITHLLCAGANVSEVDELDLLDNLTHAYLQRNFITKIEGFTFNSTVRFLALFDNQITKVENIRHLKDCVFLDLCRNNIHELDPEELPENLRVLNLAGNPIALQDEEEYMEVKQAIIAALPYLQNFDGEVITDHSRRNVYLIEYSDDEAEEEEEEDEDADLGMWARNEKAKLEMQNSKLEEGIKRAKEGDLDSASDLTIDLESASQQLRQYRNEIIARSKQRQQDFNADKTSEQRLVQFRQEAESSSSRSQDQNSSAAANSSRPSNSSTSNRSRPNSSKSAIDSLRRRNSSSAAVPVTPTPPAHPRSASSSRAHSRASMTASPQPDSPNFTARNTTPSPPASRDGSPRSQRGRRTPRDVSLDIA